MSASKTEIHIINYLSGNASPEETAKLKSWLKESPSNQEEFDRLEKVWNASLNLRKDKDADVDKAWADFKNLTQSGTQKPFVQKSNFVWLRVAAAVTLFLVMGIVAKVYFAEPANVSSPVISSNTSTIINTQPATTPDVTAVPSDSTDFKKPAKYKVKPSKKSIATEADNNNTAMVIITAEDSAKIFMLPDNSIVYLNANSKIEYPQNFNKTNRRLSLIGEAYFDIKKDSGQFVVACENTITRGKGTSFNIKSRPEDKEVEVIVASGKVEFSGIGYKDFKKLVIGAGETGRYIKEKNTVLKSSFQRKNYKWWQLNGFRERIKRFFEKIMGKSSDKKSISPSK